jgi:hypothetical protein
MQGRHCSAEWTTTPAVIFRYKPKASDKSTLDAWVRVASGTQDGTRILIGIGAPASAENFVNFKFRQLPVSHARLLSEYQSQYPNHWGICQ